MRRVTVDHAHSECSEWACEVFCSPRVCLRVCAFCDYTYIFVCLFVCCFFTDAGQVPLGSPTNTQSILPALMNTAFYQGGATCESSEHEHTHMYTHAYTKHTHIHTHTHTCTHTRICTHSFDYMHTHTHTHTVLTTHIPV